MRVAAVLGIVIGVGACATPSVHSTVFVPESLTDCPVGAAAPRPIPVIVGVPALRSGFDRTEAARQRDHLAAYECRHALHEVMAIIDDFNRQHRRAD